ncbi:MAG: hypothetical protein AABY18_10370 [Candidatus Thermoplasmatota archaeon]
MALSETAGRLGWAAQRTLPVVAAAALGVGLFWWFAAEAAFEGNARSLLLVDAAALVLAAVGGWLAATRWRGRAAAFLVVVALAAVGLWVTWVVYNLLHPGHA